MRPCAILRDSVFRPGQAWHRRCGSDVKGESTSLLVRAAPSRQTHSSMRSVSLSRTIFLSYYLLYSISEEASYPTHRKYPLCPQLAKDFPGQVVWSSIDVTDAQAAVGLEQLVKRVGGMDLFLYVSGVAKMNPNLDPEPEEVTLRTNALGFTRMVGAAYRYFVRQGHDHIAVITLIAGIRGLGPSPSYSATEALQSTYIEALEQLSHAQRINIRFTDIRPGFIDAPLLHGDKFPHTLSADKASRSILKAIYSNKHVAYIDGFWHA